MRATSPSRSIVVAAVCVLAGSACSSVPDLRFVEDDSDGGADALVDASARKKAITFDATKVAGTLIDFPVWIELVDPEVAARARADGADLSFTSSDGTALAHEIQRWDRTTGRLYAWVRLPQISNAAPTRIYLRYGDGTGAPAPAPAKVFSSSFAAVFHLDDALTTTTIAEATGARPGTAVNKTAGQQVAAKLGGGIAFSGGNDEITFTNPLSAKEPHTISLWVSQTATSDNDALVVLGNPACGESRWLHSRYNTSTVATGFFCSDWENPGVNVVDVGFTLLHWVFEGANSVSRIYKDGALVAGPFTHGSAISTKGTAGHLGFAPAEWGSNMGAHATLDEVRIATVARSAEWIATEYANQSSPSTFYSVGPEEPK